MSSPTTVEHAVNAAVRSVQILLIFVILQIALPASADDFSVTTTTHGVEDARAPSGFVTRLEIEDTFAEGRDLADVLARVPGLWVRRQSSLGQSAYVNVRGGNARQVSVSIDGQRLNVPYGAGFDVGTLSMSGLESIDIYRGAAGASRGSGALTGALNIKTSMRGEPGWQTRATTLAGSFGTLGMNADAEWANDDLSLRISGMARKSDGDFAFIDPEGTRQVRVNNDHQKTGVLTTSGYQFDRDTDLKMTASFESGERGTPGPSEFQRAFDQARLEDMRVFSTIRARQRNVVSGSAGAFDAHQRVGAQWRDQTYTNEETLLGEQSVESLSEYLSVNAGVGGLLYLNAGNITHVDADLRSENYQGTQTLNDESIDADRLTMGLAISNELLLLDERVSLIAGVRGEILDGKRSDSAVLPSAGAVLRPWEIFHLRGNVARTWRAPDFDELYLDIETVRGNPDLEPERALTWDAGFVVGPEWLRGQVAYFENHIDSLILFLPVSSYVLEATNLREATSRGIEAGVTSRPMENLSVEVGYTYTDASLESSPDTQLPHQPEHAANLRAEVELSRWVSSFESLRLVADAQTRSRVNLDNFGNLTNPFFVTGDLGAAARPVSWIELGLTVRNVSDEQTIVDSLQQPLPGRSFYASLTLIGGTP